MKKLLWLMILFPIFMTRVWANETYYSEYGEFSNYQQDYVEASDTVEVETKLMYKWYKNVKKPGEFKLYNSSDNFLDDCYYTEYSSWSNTKPEITEATILEEKTIYNYQMVKPIRYIHIYDVIGSYDAFRITELQIFIDDVEIDYSYECDGCWTNFDEYIHNGIYFENQSYIDNNGYLIVDLGDYYPINKVKVLFYLFDMGNTTKEYTLGYSYDASNIFINKSFEHEFNSEYLKDAQKFEYQVYDIAASNDMWLTSETKEEYIDNDYVYSKDSYQQYRYKNKMCKTYTLEKEYYPQYSETAIDDYTLKSDEKTFYRYRVRDKLELNIYDITQKNYNLNNFVVSNTDDYTIEHNINWDKNGTYDIKFTLNGLIVEDNVNLVVLENSLEEKDEEIEQLKQQLENTISDYEKIIETLEKTNAEYLKSLNDLNAKIYEINNKILELEAIDSKNELEISSLKEQLQKHIEEYNLKIQELEKINQSYLENFDILNKTINYLDEKLTILEDSSNQKLIDLKQDIEDKLKLYDVKINELLSFNENIENKLEEVYLKIDNLANNLSEKEIQDKITFEDLYTKLEESSKKIEEIKVNNDKIFEQFEIVDNKLNEFQEQLDNLESDVKIEQDELNNQLENVKEENNNKYNEIIEEQSKINEEIENYENNVEELNRINSEYLNQINLLNQKIELLNNKLDSLQSQINSKYNVIINNQELMTNEFLNAKSEIEDSCTTEMEIIKTNLQEVSSALETKEENDINSKLNNFVLKINGVEKVSLLGLYILILIIFIGYIIYLLKKKSNKNNS